MEGLDGGAERRWRGEELEGWRGWRGWGGSLLQHLQQLEKRAKGAVRNSAKSSSLASS